MHVTPTHPHALIHKSTPTPNTFPINSWQLNDCYRAPGPIQYAGPNAHEVNLTMQYENLPEAEVGR